MKFLFFYKYDPNYSFDGYFHLDLVKHYTKAGHESKCYGIRVHEAYPNECITEYNPRLTMKDLHNIFKFDAVILLTQSRMFDHYRPPLVPLAREKEMSGCWLPKDFNQWKGTKILIDEDSHYETDNDWIKEAGIDITFQRHYSNVKRFKDISPELKCFWLPISVDTELFKPDPEIKRVNKLAMAASVVHEIYKWRKMQIETLVPLELMVDYKEQKKVGDSYINCLKSYVGHGSCSSIYDITPGKMVEIMSSGSVLFTDNTPNYGLQELFPEGSYVAYERDGSDMVQKAQRIINEPEWVKEITTLGRKTILERHTHEIRIKEMVDIIKTEI